MSTFFFSDNTVNELRLEGQLCDAVLTVDDVEFNVHRIILCNCGSYFRDLFRSKSSTSGQQVYSFSQVSPSIMHLIVDYAYTGSVVVTEENVLELLAGADFFRVQGIMEACCHFLEQHLSSKTCVHIWRLADTHRCPDLRNKAYLHMLHHFKEVAGFSLKFLQLSVEQLVDLIKMDELNVRQESTVFEAIIQWIAFAPEERSCHMTTLLSKVRLLLMSTEYLMNTVIPNPHVTRSPLCTKMVTQAMKTLRESGKRRPLQRPRLPPVVLFAIAGWANNCPTNRIEVYNARADRWARAVSEEAPRAFYGCVFLGGFVYCVGGYDGLRYLSSVRKLDLAARTWHNAGPMHAARCYVGVVALGGCVYALGGCDGNDKLKSVERYRPDVGQWTRVAPMNEKRSNAGAATLHGKVYICGGFDRNDPLSSAECYTPDADQWTRIASMGIGCNAARAAAFKGKIYVIGGYRNRSHTSRVLAYDPLSDRWSAAAPMISPRSSFGVAVLEDQLYVAGGFDDHGTLSEVERFDEKADRWHPVRGMKVPRSGLSCCVVDRHPYATAYL
ncbi:kelch-like protein 10 isoform X1 [Etheostoma spectabile]|uniref:kelch-like protein 10 isoform X1 n=1 Tax=Etheostoma spectabile TaxID=54343 RepID=UPI0013AFB227|nr:kelch-like protein 10 isoform X1 [Etheostoma spectabile]